MRPSASALSAPSPSPNLDPMALRPSASRDVCPVQVHPAMTPVQVSARLDD
jgi:hypothetical protein